MASAVRCVVVQSLNSFKKSINVTSFRAVASDVKAKNKITHTGQKWEEDDYRLVRFTERPKEINERFAINLIAEVPPNPVHSRSTYCDGGGGPLGHPKVYINLDQPGNHACGYCGLRFFQDHNHGHH